LFNSTTSKMSLFRLFLAKHKTIVMEAMGTNLTSMVVVNEVAITMVGMEASREVVTTETVNKAGVVIITAVDMAEDRVAAITVVVVVNKAAAVTKVVEDMEVITDIHNHRCQCLRHRHQLHHLHLLPNHSHHLRFRP